MSFVLMPKDIKRMRRPILLCPQPQYNSRCQGKFLRTRVGQIECLECMKVHGTVEKHPLYKKLTRKYDIMLIAERQINICQE